MKSAQSPNRDVTSIPGYVIKKNSSRGAKHGPSRRQRMYHQAKQMLKKGPSAKARTPPNDTFTMVRQSNEQRLVVCHCVNSTPHTSHSLVESQHILMTHVAQGSSSSLACSAHFTPYHLHALMMWLFWLSAILPSTYCCPSSLLSSCSFSGSSASSSRMCRANTLCTPTHETLAPLPSTTLSQVMSPTCTSQRPLNYTWCFTGLDLLQRMIRTFGIGPRAKKTVSGRLGWDLGPKSSTNPGESVKTMRWKKRPLWDHFGVRGWPYRAKKGAKKIRNKWDWWKSSAQSERRHLCCSGAIRSAWKLVGRFHGMLYLETFKISCLMGRPHVRNVLGNQLKDVAIRSGQWMVGGFHGVLLLSTKHSRSLVWREDSIWKRFVTESMLIKKEEVIASVKPIAKARPRQKPTETNFAKILPNSNVWLQCLLGNRCNLLQLWKKYEILAESKPWRHLNPWICDQEEQQSWSQTRTFWTTKNVQSGERDAEKRPVSRSTNATQRYFHDGTPVKRTETRCMPSGGEKNTMSCDGIALETHIYVATRAERIQNSKHWILTISAEGLQQPLNQRPDFAQAKRECKRLHDEHPARTQQEKKIPCS